MIVRIVNLKMHREKVSVFLDVFEENKDAIRHAPGCRHLELLQGSPNDTCITTYSHWDSEEDLNNYRSSTLFGQVWPAIKACLIVPAEANSYLLKEKVI